MTTNLLRALLDGNTAFRYTKDVRDDACLLDEGVVDSFGMIALVMQIEDRFGIRVLPEEATAESFKSISSIARFIEAKQNDHHRR